MTVQQPYSGHGEPEISGEQLPPAQNRVSTQLDGFERQPMSSELPTAQGGGAMQQQMPAILQTPPVAGGQAPSHAMPAAAPVAVPLVADDVDVIEKEWVQRAKALVAKTKDNPHDQNKEMNKFKADYIKKRYNKEIKVSEG